MQDILVHDFLFPGINVPALTAAAVTGPWAKADTSAAGAPTLLAVAGEMVGTLAADVEVENLCLYFGDVLSFDIDRLIRAEFWIRISGVPDATISLAWGMAAARNDAIDTIADHASFRCIGNASVVVESDDALHDNDDAATGQTLSTTMKHCVIDFSIPHTQTPPSASLAGKGNVQFSIDDAYGNLRRVAAGTRFDMSNYAAGLQPYVQLQKTANAATLSFYLKRVRITEQMA